jgi:hypothetical protein
MLTENENNLQVSCSETGTSEISRVSLTKGYIKKVELQNISSSLH